MHRRLLGAKREFAERYLLITIAAFATTVALTRWYLDMTGYPTIGGGELHVAHVLWGGLALVAAVLLPMLFVGQRAMVLSALLAGVGVGLFIDEVGKFLTTTNDYFYAPAAPIIYGGVLLLVLLWFVVRRIGGHTRFDATHAMVEALGDSVDGNLTRSRRDRVMEEMTEADADAAADHSTLEAQLLGILGSPAVEARFGTEGWVASGRARALLERILPSRVERAVVLIALTWSALQAVVAVAVLLFWEEIIVGGLEVGGDAASPLEYPSEPIWSLLLLGISVAVGVGCAVAISLVRRGRERDAMTVAALAVLGGMIAGDLVAFYAFQLGALASTLVDLVTLGLIVDYRIRLDRAVRVDEPVTAD